MRIPLSFTLALSTSFGCLAAEGDDTETDLELSETTQSVEPLYYPGFQTVTAVHTCEPSYQYGNCYVDLGDSAGRTCWIGGIYGSFEDAGVMITHAGDRVRLEMYPSDTRRLRVKTVCATTTSGRDQRDWHFGDPSKVFTSSTSASRHCFLAGILNFGTDHAFDNTADYVEVKRAASGYWQLGASVAGNPWLTASAVCINTPFASGQAVVQLLPGSAPHSGTLIDNSSNMWACGYEKLGGVFTTDSYADNANVMKNQISETWTWHITAGKQATMRCVK